MRLSDTSRAMRHFSDTKRCEKTKPHVWVCVSPLDCAFSISGGQVICCKMEGRDYFTPISVDPAPALSHRKPCQWGHRREREGWYLKPHPFSVNLSTPPPSPVQLVPARQSRKPCVPNRKRPSPSTTCIPNSTYTHKRRRSTHRRSDGHISREKHILC